MTGTVSGWSNRQTWNVVLWVLNDKGLYDSFGQAYKDGVRSYQEAVEHLGFEDRITGDGYKLLDPELDYPALDDMYLEMFSCFE